MPILISLGQPASSRSTGGLRTWRRRPAPEDERPVSGFLPLFLTIASFLVASATAAERPTPLQEVLRDKDGNFVPDRLGETFTVSGVLVSDPVNRKGFGPDGAEYASLANLQDDTGAIVLFTRDTGFRSCQLSCRGSGLLS